MKSRNATVTVRSTSTSWQQNENLCTCYTRGKRTFSRVQSYKHTQCFNYIYFVAIFLNDRLPPRHTWEIGTELNVPLLCLGLLLLWGFLLAWQHKHRGDDDGVRHVVEGVVVIVAHLRLEHNKRPNHVVQD